MRKAFITTLLAEAKKNPRIMLLTGDLGFTVFEEYIARFPDQFINVGVAESNMVGIAAGLAMTGKTVLCYSIASFATARTYEQVKIDIAAHDATVILVGSGAGLSYSTASITHHSLDDIGLMRLIPGMTVLSPGDNIEAAWCLRQAIALKKPAYLRLSKQDEPDVHDGAAGLSLGKGAVIAAGTEIALLATGAVLGIAAACAKLLAAKRITPTLVSFHTLKPVDSSLIEKLSRSHKLLVTVEEHGQTGGLGTAVAEVLAETGTGARLLRIGTPDEFILTLGTLSHVRNAVGLDPEIILRKIMKLYAAK
jgi:transketolase